MSDVSPSSSPHDVADLLSDAFAGHTMQRVRTPDGRYRYSYVSEGVRESLGLDPDALMQMEAVDHHWVHPEDRGRFVAALEASASTLGRLDLEVRVELDGGGHKWVRSIGSPRRLEDGTTIWDGVALDVTDRREAVEALQKTLSQVRANETSGARFSRIAASDVAKRLAALEQAVAALPPDGSAAALVKTQFDVFKRTLSAARGLVEQNEDVPVSAGFGEGVASPDKEVLNALTHKQRAVLSCVSQGLPNQKIADELGITEGTVKLHISSILKRLGVRNRTEAALRWKAVRS